MLDGPWAFRHWTGTAPGDDWVDPNSPRDDFATLELPASWSVHGYGIPIYTNVQYPFDVSAYPDISLPDEGGDHVRVVDIPADWSGDRVIVHIGAAESFVQIWVDGHPVGYSTDSRLPAEFDITDHVGAGSSSTIALRVQRWSASSWLEDQDMWWMAGIHRSVHVYRRPPQHVADVAVTTLGIDADGTATVEVRVDVETRSERAVAVSTARATVDDHHVDIDLVTGAHGSATGVARVEVPDARSWTAETPNLTDVVVELLVAGEVVDTARVTTGIRTVRAIGGQLLVNGTPITVRGVNRHDHYPDGGRVIDSDLLDEDLRLLKSHNFNAIRTAHYPHVEELYERCDRVGLYVVDETNLECHGLVRDLVTERAWMQHPPSPTDEPQWRDHFVERGARMVARDRNHPCVIAWSLGNEAGWGDNHRAMADRIRALDPSRPVVYHPAEDDPVVDMIGPMYPSVGQLLELGRRADERPVVMCEYSHAMGNSNGGVADYDDAVDAEHRLSGGFVWDWVDQGLPRHTGDGTRFWAYGGDFGDEPNDANFNCNGLVDADRRPHPALAHFAWVHRPLVTTLVAHRVDTGEKLRVRVRNRWSFLDTAHLSGRWTRRVDGTPIGQGTIDPTAIAPGESAVLDLGAPGTPIGDDDMPGEHRLLVEWVDVTGHRVAWDDLALPIGRGRHRTIAPHASRFRPTSSSSIGGSVEIRDADTIVRVGALEVAIDPLGVPQAWTADGHDWIRPGGRLGITRALTDNDRAGFGPEQAAVKLRTAGLLRSTPRTVAATSDRRPDGVVVVERIVAFGEEPHALTVFVRWLVHPSGIVACDVVSRADPSVPPLLRLGFELPLTTGDVDLHWYGPGPHETYPDRDGGAEIARWSAPVDGSSFDSARPQETGNHTGVRWAGIAQGDRMLLAVGDPVFDTALRSVADGDIRRQRHPHEVERSPFAWWRLDAAHGGLGTGSCGPGVAERHQVHPDQVRNRILFTTTTTDVDPADAVADVDLLRRLRTQMN